MIVQRGQESVRFVITAAKGDGAEQQEPITAEESRPGNVAAMDNTPPESESRPGEPVTASGAEHMWELQRPEGRIIADMAEGVTESGEPVRPTRKFQEEIPSLYLVTRSSLPKDARLKLNWYTVDVEGYEPEQRIAQATLKVPANGTFYYHLDAPKEGFSPGRYRAELTGAGETRGALEFEILPRFPWAERTTKADLPHGYNIALAALGGRVEKVTSQYDENRWDKANLVDGLPFTLTSSGKNCEKCGWASKDGTHPQEIVLSFNEHKEAKLAAVIVDPTTWETQRHPNRMPKYIEVWVSPTDPDAGFVKVATARLHRDLAEQMIRLPEGTAARYLKLTLTANFGDRYTQLGEVKVIESDSVANSVLDDYPINLARPELDGVLAYFTSWSDKQHTIGRVVDGEEEGQAWHSYDGYLPQDFVLAFRDDQSALIDHISLASSAAEPKETWPKRISISVSSTSPLDGFEEVGTFELVQQAGKQEFPLGRQARFVKLRILDNYGGSRTSLGELAAIEGHAQGYVPLLLRPGNRAGKGSVQALTTESIEESAHTEAEPNDSMEQPNPLRLETFSRGKIDPLGEEDYYYFEPALPDTGALTLELVGRPNIRTSLALLDDQGGVLKAFDPGRIPKERTALTWSLAGDERFVRVTEPEVSVVLVWDTSGSMQGQTGDLEQAVKAYIEQVPANQQLNLLRFSEEVEVLLDDFTTDKARLEAAIDGKFTAKGGTRFYDAVATGLELLEQRSGNRALVVMSDGADTGSKLPYPSFWRLLDEKRVRFYAIALGQGMRDYQPHFGTTGERLLGHTAQAMNGQMFFAERSEELAAFYQQIATELHRTSSYYIKPTLSRGMGRFDVVSTGERIARVAAPQVELILDASGSMREKRNLVNGRLKIDVAKDVLRQVIETMPEGSHVALRVYGRKIREGRPGDCEDTELIYPFAALDRNKLLNQVDKIKALGTTPLAYALEQAARDFGDALGEKIIILITDGKEECDGQPEEVVAALAQQGLNVRVNVVGFALADAKTKLDMEKVAARSGGRFYDATDQDALEAALEQAMAAPFELQDAAGQHVAKGVTGSNPIEVPEGHYKLVVQAVGEPILVRDVRIAHEHWTRVVLKKEGQEVGSQVSGPVPLAEYPGQ
jgi:Mg-chelatase subunit ChlD